MSIDYYKKQMDTGDVVFAISDCCIPETVLCYSKNMLDPLAVSSFDAFHKGQKPKLITKVLYKEVVQDWAMNCIATNAALEDEMIRLLSEREYSDGETRLARALRRFNGTYVPDENEAQVSRHYLPEDPANMD